jgi:lipopolysaccharide export system protein LptC
MNRGKDALIFRAARRHSRLVHFLRIAIPAGALLAAIVLVTATYFNPMRILGKLPIKLGNLVISGTKVTMEELRMNGFTHDKRPYDFVAGTAVQDVTKPEIMDLKQINGNFQMEGSGTVNVVAVGGVYNSKKEEMKLEKEITLTTTGYQGHLNGATIDMRTGNMVSDNPVEIKLPKGTLNANRVRITDGGSVINFEGGVKMVLVPEKAVKPPAAPAPAAAPGAPQQ